MLFAAGFKKVEHRFKLDENDIKQLVIVNDALQAKIHQMKNVNNNGFNVNKSRFSITELSYFSLLSPSGQCDCPFCGRSIISKTYVAKKGIISRCSRCRVEASGGDIYYECIQHNAGIHDVVIPGHLYTLCENCGLTMQQSVNHHPTLITMNESGNIDDMVQYMMNMGFSRNSVLYAIEISKVEINLALSYLIYGIRPHQITLTVREIPQNYNQILPTRNKLSSIEFEAKNDVDCADISNCTAFLRLKKILKSHDNGKLNNQSVNMLNISMTLNDYHHLLQEHSSDKEFEWIAESLGICIRSKCLKLQATYRDRSIERNEKCIRTSARCQILDKIHCHFYHCYDSGYKLRQNQRNQIQNLHDSMTPNDQLLESIECNNSIINNINNMLSSNRKLNRNIKCKERVHKFNQLSDSNTVNNDEKINNEQKVNNQNYDIYSYGIKFYYWKWYQNSQNNSQKTNYAKYKSFKQELLQNAIAKISCQQFDTEMKKATINHKTKFCKKRIAKPNYISTTHWGIKNNAKIKVQHLVSILIYCGYDVLQYHFSKTFRRNNSNQNVASVKVRNAEFFYLSKLLYETVNIYGILCGGSENKTKSFYHGINKEMIFDSLSFNISAPLSTTSSFAVAVNFSKNIGMILELSAHVFLKYWDCHWLSDFSNESEKLFVGGFYPLTFVNIVQPSKSLDHRKYTLCVEIIDRLMTNYDYSSEQQLQDVTSMPQTHDAMSTATYLNYRKSHTISTQYLTRWLIRNELNKSQEMKMEINPYIQTLFHHICLTRKKVMIDTMLFQWRTRVADCLFLKKLLCLQTHDISDQIWLNIDVLSELYPNLECIILNCYATISLLWFGHILQFLSHQKSTNIGHIVINFDEKSKIECIQKTFPIYFLLFDEIGFNISIQQDTAVTVIKKEFTCNCEKENDENMLLWMDDDEKTIYFERNEKRYCKAGSVRMVWK